MTKLTAHFTLEELYRSDKANELRINNVPNVTEAAHLKELAVNILEPVRIAVGLPIKVNSGYRGPKTNTAVGGSKTSAHLYGYAADIVCPQYGTDKEFAKFVRDHLIKNNIKFDQIIYEFNSWVHVGVRNGKGLQRGQVITINSKGTFQGIV